MSVLLTGSQTDPASHIAIDDVKKLVYGVSHDMGAPMRAVVEFSKLLISQADDRLDENELYWLQLIQESGEKAQTMIAALVQYSCLMESSVVESSFVLGVLLEAVIEKSADRIKSKSASIEMSVDGIELYGDRESWKLFFECLIDNALLYQAKDDNHKPIIHIKGRRLDDCLQIHIEDNGIGIRESDRESLTTPFKRLQREQDYPGIGMGLAYCERIAQLHGGVISFARSRMDGLTVIYQQTVKSGV